MGMPQARMGDMIIQNNPHCHAPIHPPAPVPTPLPHPPMPITIIKGQPNVLVGMMPAARVTDMSAPCILPGCVPGRARVDLDGLVHGVDRDDARRARERHDQPSHLRRSDPGPDREGPAALPAHLPDGLTACGSPTSRGSGPSARITVR